MGDLTMWLREWYDRLVLSDHEWKKKYCPHIYHYLFEMGEKERSEFWKQVAEREKDDD